MMTSLVESSAATSNSQRGSRHTSVVQTRYVRLDEDTHGWVAANLDNSTIRVGLCEYTKVTLVKEEGGKIYFRIEDGLSPYCGSVVWMKTQNANNYLKDTPPKLVEDKVRVKYGKRSKEDSPFKGSLDQLWGALNIDGQDVTVTLNSIWNKNFSPIPVGTHKIMVPDYSHGKFISTEGYRDSYPGKIKGNDAWFPIELDGSSGNSSRYVHIGHLSEGCVTVHELERWNVVYNYLISRRIPNTKGKYVAHLEVVK